MAIRIYKQNLNNLVLPATNGSSYIQSAWQANNSVIGATSTTTMWFDATGRMSWCPGVIGTAYTRTFDFTNITQNSTCIFPNVASGTIATIDNAQTFTAAQIFNPTSGASVNVFTVTAANATTGATYTNNGATFTVVTTISGTTTLVCTAASGTSTSSGTLTKASGTGDATITFSAVTQTYNAITTTGYVSLPAGSATATSINGGTAGTGIYFPDSTSVSISILSTNRMTINTSGVNVPSTNGFIITSRAQISSTASNSILLSNSGITDFSLLQFGGTTSSFPALKRSTTKLQARLADDSVFANIQGKLQTDTNYTAGVQVPTGYITIYDATGTAYKVSCNA